MTGGLELAGSGSKVRLENGTTFDGATLSGTASLLTIDTDLTLDNETIDVTGVNSGGTATQIRIGDDRTVTLGANAQVNLSGAFANFGGPQAIPGNGVVINNGTITAGASANLAQTRSLSVKGFDNQGIVQAIEGNGLRLFANAQWTNYSDTILTGGTWRAAAGSALQFKNGNITANAAEIILSGAGSSFTVTNSDTPLEATLTTNAAGGALRILGNRGYSATASFTNAGIVELGGGTFDATMLDNQAGGEIFGFGNITPVVANGGLVRATGGTLTPAAGVSGSGGGLQIDATGVLDLSTAVSTVGTLTHNGSAAGSLNVGANDLVVSIDYDNANFGVGSSFDPRANVAGTGLILAGGDVMDKQTLAGDLVTGGNTAAAALAFGDVHVGDVASANYRVHNDGTTGPALRGAIQTGNITDTQLSGSGAADSNFGPIATGDSTIYTVVYSPDQSHVKSCVG